MRLLRRLLIKLFTMVAMIVLMSIAVRFARPYLMKSAGLPEGMPQVEMGTPKFSSEESDLMGAVLKSAMRLLSGSASRNELAGELSEKLYQGRGDAKTMSELGIELIKPGDNPASGAAPIVDGKALADAKATPAPGARPAETTPGRVASNSAAAARKLNAGDAPTAEAPSLSKKSTSALDALWLKLKANGLELALVPVALLMMVVVGRFRRKSGPDAFVPAVLAAMPPADTEPYDMKHDVHSMKAEDFEMLVGLIYQRQGYRVLLPAGLGGGRNGDFVLAKKSERILVVCKRLNPSHEVPVEKVRELHDVAAEIGAARAIYVAPCRFTWDARNFARTNRLTLVNGRTLDELILAARKDPEENLLDVSQWASAFMSKVELTPPLCPACEEQMDEVRTSHSSVWVCSQRPDCRGRRSSRNYQKAAPAPKADASTNVEAAPKTEASPKAVAAPQTESVRTPAVAAVASKIAVPQAAAPNVTAPPVAAPKAGATATEPAAQPTNATAQTTGSTAPKVRKSWY